MVKACLGLFGRWPESGVVAVGGDLVGVLYSTRVAQCCVRKLAGSQQMKGQANRTEWRLASVWKGEKNANPGPQLEWIFAMQLFGPAPGKRKLLRIYGHGEVVLGWERENSGRQRGRNWAFDLGHLILPLKGNIWVEPWMRKAECSRRNWDRVDLPDASLGVCSALREWATGWVMSLGSQVAEGLDRVSQCHCWRFGGLRCRTGVGPREDVIINLLYSASLL